MGSESQSEKIARLRALADLAQAALRRAATAIDVKTGYACPEPDCGLRYRHQHEYPRRSGMSDDLVTWLRAQLDADSQLLAEASRALGALKVHLPGYGPGEPLSIARVLAEVEAKRRILDLHAVADNGGGDLDSRFCQWCYADRGYNADVSNHTGEGLPVWCRTVRLLALPYAANPGYREEWAP